MPETTADPRIVPMVAGAIVTLSVIAVLAIAMVRRSKVNRARTSVGGRKVSMREVVDARASGVDLSAASDEDLARIESDRRQREWERAMAGQELARYGRSVSRAYCRAHDRWCKSPDSGPHPSGGHDNESVPDDWVAPS